MGFEQVFGGSYGWIVLVVVFWSIPWKGAALWKAARRGERWWFVALFVINTAAILEILYLFVFSKKEQPSPQPPPPATFA